MNNKKDIENIFKIPELNKFDGDEFFNTILKKGNLKIERIVSKPFFNSDAHWYDQESDEWVLLLSGTAKIEFEDEIKTLISGNYLFIPSHKKHRVIDTRGTSPCIWLAIHF